MKGHPMLTMKLKAIWWILTGRAVLFNVAVTRIGPKVHYAGVNGVPLLVTGESII
jgi:hypothetical protein